MTARVSLSKPVTKMERRIISSINLEDGKIGVYMDKLVLGEKKRDYYEGSVVQYLNKEDTISYPATFFILNDFAQVGRIFGDSRRMKCDNLLAPCAVGVEETNQWVVAFRNTIDDSFIEWADKNPWIDVLEAENIVSSLVQLMECVHRRSFRIGHSLENPRCYGLMSGKIFLIDLEGSICSLLGKDEGEEIKLDMTYLHNFLKENILSKLEDRAGLTLRDFVQLMNVPLIKFSDLKGHPFCIPSCDVSWLYNRINRWLRMSPTDVRKVFETRVASKKNVLRWKYFPDWMKIVQRYELLDKIYQHDRARYVRGAWGLISLGRNGMTHIRDYHLAKDSLIVAMSIDKMLPSFLSVCYTAMIDMGGDWISWQAC